MNGTLRLVIAHDDRLLAEVLGFACAQRGVEVTGSACDYEDLINQCRVLAPHVVVASDWLADAPIEEAIERLAEAQARVIVLSADSSPDRIAELLASDVAGLMSYDASPDEIVSGIQAVARGEVAVDAAVVTVILGQWRRLRAQPVSFGARRRPTLTPRELDILTAMIDGLAAKAIAARLGMALKTVENHKIRIFEKLGVRSHAHAVTMAMAYGLAKAPDCP